MEIKKKREGTKCTVSLSGRLDTTTAPEFDQSVKEDIDDLTELVVDLKDLEYMSSAGLRVMLALHKKMSVQGSMKVINVNSTIMEIFELTGFSDIMNIEQ